MSARQRVRLVALAGVVTAGLGAAYLAQWASAQPPSREYAPPSELPKPVAQAPAKPEPVAPRKVVAAPRIPSGTFVKEFEAEPYGSGRLAWTYADDRVSGVIELDAPMLGGEIELATESEVSMSSNGVIYGVINSVRLNRLRINPELLGDFKVGPAAYPLVEPLVNDTLVDVPFSYQCRIQGDRITISNYRILLAGPNPLGKLYGITGGDPTGGILTYFQAINVAIEGTYTLSDGKEAKPRRKGGR